MKKIGFILIIPLMCALLTSCSETKEQKTIYAMNTVVTLTAYGENAKNGIDKAEDEIYRLDALMSRSGKRGDIYTLNSTGYGTVSSETASVINTALDVCRSTDGAFDITVTPLMDAWGFFGQNHRVPDIEEISQLLQRVDYKNVLLDGSSVTLNGGAQIDLGGIAKGYASGVVSDTLIANGVTSGLISFGSAIQAIGTKPDGSEWKIGLANPQDSDDYIATIALSDECIATSGSYEQVFEEDGHIYHHIIDPKTGYPAMYGLASVSIISDDPARADALATALFVMGFGKAVEYQKEHNDFEAIFIDSENKIYYTAGMTGKISVLEGYETEIC